MNTQHDDEEPIKKVLRIKDTDMNDRQLGIAFVILAIAFLLIETCNFMFW